MSVLSPQEIRRRREHGRNIRRGWSPDLELCAVGGRRGAGLRVRRAVVECHGIAGMRPGKIPGWWWGLSIKPNPRVLFEADWPDEVDTAWHMSRQSLIHGRYKFRKWYPAFARGISWYQLCRERDADSSVATTMR